MQQPAAHAGSAGSAGQLPHLLVVFDFDHTVVDGNTDTYIVRAPDALPAELVASYEKGQWTAYMGRVLGHLHSKGIGAAELQRELHGLELTAGMPELLQALQAGSVADGQPCSAIIISDSNSCFIDWLLSHWGYDTLFSAVYTNPAAIDAEGRVTLAPHHQHGCSACPINLCKRAVLQAHVAAHHAAEAAEPAGRPGLRLAYVGDGLNDACAAQWLAPGDVVFPRAGFALDKHIRAKAGVAAQVVRWQSGEDILRRLQQGVV